MGSVLASRSCASQLGAGGLVGGEVEGTVLIVCGVGKKRDGQYVDDHIVWMYSNVIVDVSALCRVLYSYMCHLSDETLGGTNLLSNAIRPDPSSRGGSFSTWRR